MNGAEAQVQGTTKRTDKTWTIQDCARSSRRERDYASLISTKGVVAAVNKALAGRGSRLLRQPNDVRHRSARSAEGG